MTLQSRIPTRQPSEELLNLIREVGKLGTKLSELFEVVKQKGHEEGFTDQELRDILRIYLKRFLTRSQIKWYLYEKDKHRLRMQNAGTSQIEGNKVTEQNTENIELRSRTKIHGSSATIPNSVTSTIVVETTAVKVDQEKKPKKTESVKDLNTTVKSQVQYINKLKNKLREKQEVQSARLRIRTSTNQLYRDILRVRISNDTYANILIDNNKYVGLEPI